MMKPDDVRCGTCPYWKDEGYYFNNESGSCHCEFATHPLGHHGRDHLDWCGRHPDFQRALQAYITAPPIFVVYPNKSDKIVND